jgi:meiotically up-regulated gene 157 (Mug157) protein
VPSLLSLPYIGAVKRDDPFYMNTRKYLLSEKTNPYYTKGKAGEGIASPHINKDMIWPMAIILRAMTSTDDKEILDSLKILKATHAGTGFMHESFYKDDATKYTRDWFAWANTLFGELIIKVAEENPRLLQL